MNQEDSFVAQSEKESRSVSESLQAVLTDKERRILDMWPKFEDGAPLMYEDEFQLGGEAHTAYGFNFGVYGRVSIGVEQGSHVRLPNGERVERPEPKVVDADGVEIKVGDTVWHHSGFAHGVVTSIDAGSLMNTTRYVDESGTEFRDAARNLTHTRPDSWERLEEDAEFNDETGIVGGNLDLVRRAKALAGVEAAAGR